MRQVIDQIKQSIVFFGYASSDRYSFTGTGCIIKFNEVFHIVTAKHICIDNNNNPIKNLCIFINNTNNKISAIKIGEIIDGMKVEFSFYYKFIFITLLCYLLDLFRKYIFFINC